MNTNVVLQIPGADIKDKTEEQKKMMEVLGFCLFELYERKFDLQSDDEC